MVRGAVGGGELGVEVHGVDLGAGREDRRHEHVVEDLRVAEIDVGGAIGEREPAHQVLEARSLEGCEGGTALEIVEVAEDHDPRLGVELPQAGDERPHGLRLAHPPCAGALHRRLAAAEERVVAALGREVEVDDEDRRTGESKLSDQRLAAAALAVRPRREGRAGRIEQPRAAAQRRAGRHLCRNEGPAPAAVDEAHPRRVEEEGVADVGAGLAAALAVPRVDRPPIVAGAARGHDGLDDARHGACGAHGAVVGRARVVLDLLQGDDVRAAEVAHHLLREAAEPVVIRHRRQILHVIGGDGQLRRRACQCGPLPRQSARRHIRQGRGVEQLIAAVSVVEDRVNRRREPVAHRQQGFVRNQRVVDDQALRVGVVVEEPQPAARRAQLGVAAAVRQYHRLAVARGRADHDRALDPHPHALEALEGVGREAVRIEGRESGSRNLGLRNHDAACTQTHRRRQLLPPGQDFGRAREEPGDRQLQPPRALLHPPREAHQVAHLDLPEPRRGRYQQAFGGRRVAVALRVLHPEGLAGAAAENGRDDPFHPADAPARVGRRMPSTLDRSHAQLGQLHRRRRDPRDRQKHDLGGLNRGLEVVVGHQDQQATAVGEGGAEGRRLDVVGLDTQVVEVGDQGLRQWPDRSGVVRKGFDGLNVVGQPQVNQEEADAVADPGRERTFDHQQPVRVDADDLGHAVGSEGVRRDRLVRGRLDGIEVLGDGPAG